MKSSQFSLAWKVSGTSTEGEWSRGEEGEARGGRTLPERRFRPEPACLDSPAWPLGTESDSTRRETGSMLSLNSTEVQSYNIWDFSITLTSIRFFFLFFIFCFPLIFFLLWYRYFKLFLLKFCTTIMILRGGRIRSIYRLFTTITLPSKSPGSPPVLFMVTDLISLLLSPNIHQSIYLNSSIQTYNTENHRKVSETSIGVIKAPLKVSKN